MRQRDGFGADKRPRLSARQRDVLSERLYVILEPDEATGGGAEALSRGSISP